MERLTLKQKQVFDILVSCPPMSLQGIADMVKDVSRQAILQRIQQMITKGYITVSKDRRKYKYGPTAKGVEQILSDTGKTKHSYYDKAR